MDDIELNPTFAAINGLIPDGLIWKYETVLRGGHVHHTWALIGDVGAIHIWGNRTAWESRPEWIGGIECHYSAAPEYMDPDKPSHDHCWLLGKPCWHDGSSLQFSEGVAPYLPNDDTLERRHHEMVTHMLTRRFRDYLSTPTMKEDSCG